MEAPALKIVIAGAGVAGPCLAYWLTKTRLNVSITIVERASAPRTTGQAIDIRGQGIKIVEKMHLTEKLKELHTTEEATVIVNSADKVIARLDGGAGDSRGPGLTAEYEILRADLVQIFMDATKDCENVSYIFGDHITAIDQAGSLANVTFASGKSSSFDLVVAADGSSSSTRPMILDPEVLKDSYRFLGWYMAFFTIPSEPGDPKLWQWYNAPQGRHSSIRPHRTPETQGAYFSLVTPARGVKDPEIEKALDEGVAATKALLRKRFADSGWKAERILNGMDASTDFYMARLSQIVLPTWHKGRGVLLGDAGFATLGIGTTFAIESAYVLAGELGKIANGEGGVPEALQRFEQVFRPHVEKEQPMPKAVPQIMFPQTVMGVKMLQTLVWMAGKTKAWKWFLQRHDGVKAWEPPEYDWVNL